MPFAKAGNQAWGPKAYHPKEKLQKVLKSLIKTQK